MKIAPIFASCGLLVAGLVTYQAVTPNQQVNPSQHQRATFQYGTLSTRAIHDSPGMVYTVVWNAGEFDIIGRSTVSLADAQRQLSAQLGGSSNVRTNLSVMLTRLGADGWRLIETNQDEFGTTRIFIRTAPN